jgi:hypothetical protein
MSDEIPLWDHRIISAPEENLGDPYFMIAEVSFDQTTGEPDAYSAEVHLGAESIEGLTELVGWIQKALTKPVLKWSQFPQNQKKRSAA